MINYIKKILLLSLLFFLHPITSSQMASVREIRQMAQNYRQQEQFQKAIACYESIVKIYDDSIEDWFQIGCNAISIGQFDYALEAFDKILSLMPNAIAAWYNKGFTFKQMGQLDKAIKTLRQIVKKHPDHEAAHLCLAYSYMMNGDMLNGYRFYQSHLQHAGKYAPEFRRLLESMNLQDKRILLIPEGGLGDTLQFIRYAQRVKEFGAYIIAAVQKPLVPLLKNCPYLDHVVSIGETIPKHDAKITLMSLPAAFYDRIETIPCKIPYLFPDTTLSTYWKSKLSEDTNFKIGICWQASVANDRSRIPVARRGCLLSNFTKLFSIPGTSWYSLQRHDGIEELTTIDTTNLHLFDGYFDQTQGAFMDTAAVMQSLDLIITVDSAIAHLAGAMGKPVWLLLPLVTDWRWIVNKTTSPWYPTMRIFKQTKPFEWEQVINAVQTELEKIVL